MIKEQETKGKSRGEVMEALLEEFGEKNPDVGVFYRTKKQIKEVTKYE